ncbi:MAG: gliding motility-associated C-terminal domain-containing protein, partial [Bacteroidetes bacterium]|nr:gliding motility-associated C-terminal domain-containing protein [Bacteroidota bacterium]
NDLENDLHCVLGGCIETFHITIYNRWGEMVFESTDQKTGWDGTYQGRLENTAVFVYDMKATLMNGENINKKGNISLIR